MHRQKQHYNNSAKRKATRDDDLNDTDISGVPFFVVGLVTLAASIAMFKEAHTLSWMKSQGINIFLGIPSDKPVSQSDIVFYVILGIVFAGFTIIALIFTFTANRKPAKTQHDSADYQGSIDYRTLQKQKRIQILSIDGQTDEFLWPDSKYTYDDKPHCVWPTPKSIVFIDQNGKMQKGTISIKSNTVTIIPQAEDDHKTSSIIYESKDKQ